VYYCCSYDDASSPDYTPQMVYNNITLQFKVKMPSTAVTL